MVLRLKLRLDVIFMQARARAVHGVNPRLFCTLTNFFREHPPDQSSQMISAANRLIGEVVRLLALSHLRHQLRHYAK